MYNIFFMYLTFFYVFHPFLVSISSLYVFCMQTFMEIKKNFFLTFFACSCSKKFFFLSFLQLAKMQEERIFPLHSHEWRRQFVLDIFPFLLFMLLKFTSQETSFGSQTDDDYDCEMRMREEMKFCLIWWIEDERREKIYERMTFYKILSFFIVVKVKLPTIGVSWNFFNEIYWKSCFKLLWIVINPLF